MSPLASPQPKHHLHRHLDGIPENEGDVKGEHLLNDLCDDSNATHRQHGS